MASRIQTADPALRAQVSPVARLVDTYFRPAEAPVEAQPPASNSLLNGIASGLAEIEPSLRGIVNTQFNKWTEEQVAQAQADRLRNQSSLADAVRRYEETNGAEGIPPGMNPWYVKEYNRVDGRLNAETTYRAGLVEAWQQSGLAGQQYDNEAEAAAALSQFVEGYRADFLGQRQDATIEWVQGFEEARSSIENSLASQHIAERVQNNEEQFLEATRNLVSEVIYDPTADASAKAAALDEIASNRIGQFGMSGTEVNDLLTTEIVNSATALAQAGRYDEAFEALNLADAVPTGPGAFLGQRGATREAIVAAEGRIIALQQQRETYAWTVTQRGWAAEDRAWSLVMRAHQQKVIQRTADGWVREDARDEALGAFIADVVVNPDKDFESAYFSQWATDPDLAGMIEDAQRFVLNRITFGETIAEDPDFYKEMKLGVTTGEIGFEDLIAASDRLTAQHVSELASDLENREYREWNMAQLPDAWGRPAEDAAALIRSAVTRSYTDPMAINDGGGEGDLKAAFAVGRFKELVLEEFESDPTLRGLALQQRINALMSTILAPESGFMASSGTGLTPTPTDTTDDPFGDAAVQPTEDPFGEATGPVVIIQTNQ